PHATLWTLNQNDFLLLGSTTALTANEGLLQHNFAKVASDLLEVKVKDVYSIASLPALSDEALDRFAGSAPLNTDDLPILEFHAPRFIHSDTASQNFSLLSGFMKPEK